MVHDAHAIAMTSHMTPSRSLGNLKHEEMRLFLDFLHMQGVLTHNNSELLDDLVIVDPLWLLQKVTVIIRRPSLHPLPLDRRLSARGRDLLYKSGVSYL